MSERDPKCCFVRTIGDRCKVCYTCVRECPAKAIRISAGQAQIISDRCIGCGNCIRVCSQRAKCPIDSSAEIDELLSGKGLIVACIAPSFAAEFSETSAGHLVAALRSIGFGKVIEVAFGADLVSNQYQRFFSETSRQVVTSTCPAIVSYIEKYHPSIIDALAPISSPMIATGRMVKAMYGVTAKTIFIGPCIAKKAEAMRKENVGAIDMVITFSELRSIFKNKKINFETLNPSDFDGPKAGYSIVYPVGRGLLQAAKIDEKLISSDVIFAEGAKDFAEVIKGLENGDISSKMVDLLCCQGCVMGPGFSTRMPHFKRRQAVLDYAKKRMACFDELAWKHWMDRFEYLDLSTSYDVDDHRLPAPSSDELQRLLAKIGRHSPEEELNCGACGYDTCIEHAVAIHRGLAESEMCLPSTIERLKETANELSLSYEKLSNAKQALVQSEKLASMGQLAAGIAHEVNNPLGIILLYAHILKGQCSSESQMTKDLEMLIEQAERCKVIVSGLLNFSRKNKVNYSSTDIGHLIDKAVSSVIFPKTIRIKKNVEDSVKAEVDSDQLLQVLANLFVNSVEAMPIGGLISVSAFASNTTVSIVVEDNGTGIKQEIIPKVFEPFFTTKQIGKGTGLGLAVAYGIVKMHSGKIFVESNADLAKGSTWTRFTVELPKLRKDMQHSASADFE